MATAQDLRPGEFVFESTITVSVPVEAGGVKAAGRVRATPAHKECPELYVTLSGIGGKVDDRRGGPLLVNTSLVFAELSLEFVEGADDRAKEKHECEYDFKIPYEASLKITLQSKVHGGVSVGQAPPLVGTIDGRVIRSRSGEIGCSLVDEMGGAFSVPVRVKFDGPDDAPLEVNVQRYAGPSPAQAEKVGPKRRVALPYDVVGNRATFFAYLTAPNY
jgi:hypothetical protein